MEKIEVTINDKKYNVHEMLATEFDALSDTKDIVERMRLLHTNSCEITTEEYNKLTLVKRNILTEAINKVNGWNVDITDKKKV